VVESTFKMMRPHLLSKTDSHLKLKVTWAIKFKTKTRKRMELKIEILIDRQVKRVYKEISL
jgi:hypothetical protein